MAKEKKRGFFSWLGFGQKEQEPAAEKEQKTELEQPVDGGKVEHVTGTESAQVADEIAQREASIEPHAEHSLVESETFAESIVDVSEKLAEAQEPVEEPKPVVIPETETVKVTVPETTEAPAAVEEPKPVVIPEPETAKVAVSETTAAPAAVEEQKPVVIPEPETAKVAVPETTEAPAAVEEPKPVVIPEPETAKVTVPETTEAPAAVAEPKPVVIPEPETTKVTVPERAEEPEVVEPLSAVEHETLPLPEDVAESELEPEDWQAEQDLVVDEAIAEIEEIISVQHEEADVAAGKQITAQAQNPDDTVSDAELEAAALASQPVEEDEVQQEQERPTKEGFFARLKRSLVKTKQNLGSGFIGLFRGKKIDDDLFEELEEQLLIADVGVETTRKIIGNLTEGASRKQLRDAEALYGLLKEEMGEILAKVDEPLSVEGKTPFVILMVGVNGVGKTTTIGKMARQFQQEGKSVMLAAGDTFRAAAVEQLQVWGQRNNIPVIAQHTGADSASVIFDAIQAAKARHADVLIADTAGRLQNKAHLMEELKKIVRVMKKLDEDAPHEVMLTLDASTGQNAVSQAKLFHEAVGLTGITLTKLDGTAKGGVIFSVADQFGIPIRYIGVGERIEDLRPFKADDFIEALFARED